MPALYTNPHITVHTRFFSLDIALSQQKALITMVLNIDTVNTRDLPHTYEVLKKLLPTILASQCFNDGDIPFSDEVRRTEIGHLFEHILLEYLCMHKLTLGYKRAVYTGVTSWNWKRDRRGTFHIKINMHAQDAIFFSEALKNAIELTTFLLDHKLAATDTEFKALPLLS